MIRVRLSDAECKRADEVGRARMTPGLKPGHGLETDKETGLMLNVYGAAAELAASKALQVPWPAFVNTFKERADLEPDWEVRRRRSWEFDCLVRKDDWGRVLHVVGHGRNYCVVGWISADDAKADRSFIRRYAGRPAAWFVPLNQLQPIGRSIWLAEDLILGEYGKGCCPDSIGLRHACRLPGRQMVSCSHCDRFLAFRRFDHE